MTEKTYTPIVLREVDIREFGVDAEALGRSGILTIRPKTSLIQAKLASFLAKKARESGIELTEETEDEVTILFLYDVTIFLLKECIKVPQGEPPITDEELMEYPDDLIEHIGGVIGDAEFPLGSTPGKELKSEE